MKSYTPGTIIRWSEGECHVLLAPVSSIDNVSVNEKDRTSSECRNIDDKETEIKLISSDKDEICDSTKNMKQENSHLENSDIALDHQREPLDTVEEKDIKEDVNPFDRYKNALLWSSNRQSNGSEDDEDEENSRMLVINEDDDATEADNTNVADDDDNKESSSKLHFSSHLRPLTMDNVSAHDGKSPPAEDEDDESSSVSSSSTSSSSSSSTSTSSSSSSSSDDDDRINFEKQGRAYRHLIFLDLTSLRCN